MASAVSLIVSVVAAAVTSLFNINVQLRLTYVPSLNWMELVA